MVSDISIRQFLLALWCIGGILIFILIAVLLIKKLHAVKLTKLSKKHKWLIAAVCALTVLSCTLPMGLSPSHNGDFAAHRDQYEETAEAFLHGHLYLDEAPDPKLSTLDNPYDFSKRRDADIAYEWDHSYYHDHYYMYFGVVPVILLFLPFRVIFSVSLLTFHATQIFAAGFIIGLFLLFYRLSKYFFDDLSLWMYLLLSVAFSSVSLWFGVAAPALYCTAIVSAMCMAVWSLYFFTLAVWGDFRESKAIFFSTLGALFGALEFGCRPTIAVSNLLVIPFLVVFLRKRGFNLRIFAKLVLAALPYLVVGGLLMAYNYARFDSVTEFGQSYQLTAVDMSGGTMLSEFTLPQILGNMGYYLFSLHQPENPVDWGVFITFPILFTPFFALASSKVRETIKEKKLWLFIVFVLLTAALILFLDVIFSKLTVPRYRMDLYWLFAILAFLLIGIWYHHAKRQAAFSYAFCIFAVLTIAMSVVLYLSPHDGSFTEAYGFNITEIVENIRTYLNTNAGYEI